MNAITAAIKSGRTVVGTSGAPNVDVSILADAGCDFALFDTRHSPWEIKQAAPVVRVAANEAHAVQLGGDPMRHLLIRIDGA